MFRKIGGCPPGVRAKRPIPDRVDLHQIHPRKAVAAMAPEEPVHLPQT